MRKLRVLSIFLLIAFIGVVLYFVFRPKGTTTSVGFHPASGKSFQLSFQYTEMSGGKIKYTAMADQYMVDSRNFTHLLGNIRIIIYSSNAVITAEKCTINPAMTRYEFEGSVFLQGKDEEMRTEDAIYMPKKDIVLVRSALEFKRGKMEGKAVRGRFLLKEKLAIFIKPLFRIGEIAVVGGRLDLYKRDNMGLLKGRPAGIYLSSRSLNGPRLKFFLKNGEIERVEAPDGGRLGLGEKEGYLMAAWYEVIIDKNIKARKVYLVKKDIKLEADKLNIDDKTRKVFAEDHLLMKGKDFIVSARSGEIGKKFMVFKEKVTIEKKDTKVKASLAQISRDGSRVSLEMGSYNSSGLTLKADKIKVDGDNVEASGNVVGSKEDAVFKCDRVIRKEGKEFLEGKVKIVKQGNLLRGRNVTIEGKNFTILEGSIITKEEYRVKGNEIFFSGDKIKVSGEVSIKGKELSLLASSAELFFKKGNLEMLKAFEIKELHLKGSIGQANALDYDFIKRVATLKGHAKIDSPTEGQLKGEKIVFYVDEERFEVEGRGRTSSKIKGKK